MAKDGEDPFKFATPLPLPDLPAGSAGVGAPPDMAPVPLPDLPSPPQPAVAAAPPSAQGGASFPEAESSDREILLALNGIQSTLDRLEQVVRGALT